MNGENVRATVRKLPELVEAWRAHVVAYSYTTNLWWQRENQLPEDRTLKEPLLVYAVSASDLSLGQGDVSVILPSDLLGSEWLHAASLHHYECAIAATEQMIETLTDFLTCLREAANPQGDGEEKKTQDPEE